MEIGGSQILELGGTTIKGRRVPLVTIFPIFFKRRLPKIVNIKFMWTLITVTHLSYRPYLLSQFSILAKFHGLKI